MRALLAEMETLAVSGQEAGKKAKVAAIAAPATPNPKTPLVRKTVRVERRVRVVQRVIGPTP